MSQRDDTVAVSTGSAYFDKMASRNWDFALQIKGVTLKTLPMERVAAYLKEFAALLGEEARPRFAGLVQGSVVLRSRGASLEPRALTRTRMRQAANDDAAPARAPYERINTLIAQDSARGVVVEHGGGVVVEFPGATRLPEVEQEALMFDRGSLDGVVVGIGGVDDTVHLRLQDLSGEVNKIAIRDMGMARKVALYFRGDAIRVYVHGTWRRTTAGKWVSHSLYLDNTEELDQRPVAEVLNELAAVDGNGWAQIEDPGTAWREIRGCD